MRSEILLGCALGIILGCAPAHAQSPFNVTTVNISDEKSVAGDAQSGEYSLPGDSVTETQTTGKTAGTSEKMVKVVRGDTLCGLAQKLLGSSSRWRDLVEWNNDLYPSLLKNPDLILVGWQFRLAPKPARKDSSTTTTTGGTITVAATPATSNATTPAATAATTAQAPTPKVGKPAATSVTKPIPDTTASQAGTPLITADSRVLHIGDSHTCGIYGKTIDGLMRETGAAVRTCGVAGSSPSWWLNGTVGKSGYYSRDEKGKVDQPADWRTPRQTPNLSGLIEEYKPNVIVFSLGANMAYAGAEAIQKQVQSVCDIAKRSGCKIVWVGPPEPRNGVGGSENYGRLYQNLKAAVEKYGSFVDSRNYTEYPASGGDGLHYSGNAGSKIAKTWADKVFNQIQGKPAR
ncbi:MAG TPA: LysM peptidoglycan-binding domain-containing protein [Candidatus Rifleibacterium sp.]|nr:LysM peptidoglycan-binding domain-containing protein [Candidatus Rifleibacterium sp.]HPT48193.1 LysM peptidoglycan-binding domain-containing protein [Candidatus Rifleibacterium sp.]